MIRVCFFTEEGRELAKTIQAKWEEPVILKSQEENLSDWTREGFEKRAPLVFIGASGIAVRSIAPYVQDKLTDSPVLVLDEKGSFVIPILSGHMGGANELARKLATMLGATAVLTTGTDVEQIFSVDVFAVKNGFHMERREGIREVSSKLLRKEVVRIAIDPAIEFEESDIPKELQIVPFEESADIRLFVRDDVKDAIVDVSDKKNNPQELCLYFKEYVLGMGCKKGKTFEELMDFLQTHEEISWDKQLGVIASIDLKKDEVGLLELAQYFRVPFLTFASDALNAVSGEFSESDFVKQVTGVSNVCERAALCGAECQNTDGLVVKKIKDNGMTMALAKRKPRVVTWET